MTPIISGLSSWRDGENKLLFPDTGGKAGGEEKNPEFGMGRPKSKMPIRCPNQRTEMGG